MTASNSSVRPLLTTSHLPNSGFTASTRVLNRRADSGICTTMASVIVFIPFFNDVNSERVGTAELGGPAVSFFVGWLCNFRAATIARPRLPCLASISAKRDSTEVALSSSAPPP